MKKILLAAICLSAFPSMLHAQQDDRSLLRIHLSDGAPLSVDLDGRQFRKVSTLLTIGDLPPGKHRLKVYRIGDRYDRYHPGGEVIYNGRIRIAPQTLNTYNVDVFRGTITTDARPLQPSDIPPRHRHRDGDPDENYSANHPPDNYDNGRQPAQPGRTMPPDTTASGMNRSGQVPPNAAAQPAGPLPAGVLTDGQMTDLQARVSQKLTDTDKEQLLETDLTGHSVAVAQVRAMLSWFSFESTRLDFLKWAYPVVADKASYGSLGSELKFAASQKEFDEFLQSRR